MVCCYIVTPQDEGIQHRQNYPLIPSARQLWLLRCSTTWPCWTYTCFRWVVYNRLQGDESTPKSGFPTICDLNRLPTLSQAWEASSFELISSFLPSFLVIFEISLNSVRIQKSGCRGWGDLPSLRALKYCTYTGKSDLLEGFSELNVDSHKRMCKSTHSTPTIIPLKLIKYMSIVLGEKSSSSYLHVCPMC